MSVTLRVGRVLHDSITDGPGLRTVIFLQGCPHRCEGCHNPELLDPSGGTEEETGQLLNEIGKNPLTTGVTLSGGEPMAQAPALLPFARALKERGYNLWIYTGYLWEELTGAQQELAALADVVVDGPYDRRRRSLALPWRGSANQRVIDVRKSGGKTVALIQK